MHSAAVSIAALDQEQEEYGALLARKRSTSTSALLGARTKGDLARPNLRCTSLPSFSPPTNPLPPLSAACISDPTNLFDGQVPPWTDGRGTDGQTTDLHYMLSVGNPFSFFPFPYLLPTLLPSHVRERVGHSDQGRDGRGRRNRRWGRRRGHQAGQFTLTRSFLRPILFSSLHFPGPSYMHTTPTHLASQGKIGRKACARRKEIGFSFPHSFSTCLCQGQTLAQSSGEERREDIEFLPTPLRCMPQESDCSHCDVCFKSKAPMLL